MVGVPPTPVLFFLPVVLAAVILLVTAGTASAWQTVMTKASAGISAGISCICEAARFRRKVVQQTSLQCTFNLSGTRSRQWGAFGHWVGGRGRASYDKLCHQAFQKAIANYHAAIQVCHDQHMAAAMSDHAWTCSP